MPDIPTPVIIIFFAALFLIFLIYIIKAYAFPKKLKQMARLLNSGNTKTAIKALKAFIAKNERNITAHWYLGESYYKEKRYELAIVEYKYVIKLGTFSKEVKESNVRKKLAAIYNEFNQLDEAQKEYILISTLEPNNYKVLYEIGQLFYKRNLIDNAMAYFQKALRINPQHSESHYLLGIIYYNSGKLNEARSDLSKAIEYDQRNYKAHLYLGMVYKSQQQFDSATREFESAQRDPEIKVRALLENGKNYFDRGNISKASIELERGLKSASVENDVKLEIRYWLANCYEKNRDITEAIEQWEIISQARPSYKDVGEKLTMYADLRTDDQLKDFLTASTGKFIELSKKLVTGMGYNISETLGSNDEGVDLLATEAETKWRNARRVNVIINIRRVTKPIGELPIREIHESLKKMNANRAILITTSSFAPSAQQFASTRPINLIDKNQLVTELKNIQL
jgi:tetratricopeptide (TPR) repeat protein